MPRPDPQEEPTTREETNSVSADSDDCLQYLNLVLPITSYIKIIIFNTAYAYKEIADGIKGDNKYFRIIKKELYYKFRFNLDLNNPHIDS